MNDINQKFGTPTDASGQPIYRDRTDYQRDVADPRYGHNIHGPEFRKLVDEKLARSMAVWAQTGQQAPYYQPGQDPRYNGHAQLFTGPDGQVFGISAGSNIELEGMKTRLAEQGKEPRSSEPTVRSRGGGVEISIRDVVPGKK